MVPASVARRGCPKCTTLGARPWASNDSDRLRQLRPATVSNLRMRFPSLNFLEAIALSTQKKAKKSRSRQKAKKSGSRQRTSKATRRLPTAITIAVPGAERTIEVITEKTYVTTEPEVEIRKPATLAQAL